MRNIQRTKIIGKQDENLSSLVVDGRKSFPNEYADLWANACNKLATAGYGASIPLSYIKHSPKIAETLQPDVAIDLASVVSLAAIKTNRVAGELLSKASAIVAKKYKSTQAFTLWLSTVEELIRLAPESLLPLLERTQKIVDILTPEQFRSWVLTGLRSTNKDTLRQIQYFSFANAESEKWFRHEAGDVVFTDLDRRLKLYLMSLWSLQPPIRDFHASTNPVSQRRVSISNGVIQVPDVFPGYHGEQAELIFRAALAHVGAHLIHTTKKFTLGELKPIQVALVSLLEDARVEYLAMHAFPGLRNLWLPFHVAKPSGPKLVPHIFARLSRALIDENYNDQDEFVRKGRALFFEKSNDMTDPSICRRIGVLLGNDLGQLRAQFNAKTYVVEPPYRDDNMGLWDFGDHQVDEEHDEGIFIEAMRMKPEVAQEHSTYDKNQNDEDVEQQYYARDGDVSQERESELSIRYPEYDYLTGSERPDWTCVTEYFADYGDAYKIDRFLETQTNLVNRIKSLIQSANVSLPERLRHQNVGESLDLDACINATISRRMGESPDPNIYSKSERKHRDLSVLVLLDISNSTNDIVPAVNTSVLELEIQATALLAYAMSKLQDPFGISAFCSNGKEDVHYYQIKDFDDPYDTASKALLAGLKGKLSTRMGSAMRHAYKKLSKQQSHRRLLLIITDGVPSDIDVNDTEYLVEDARKVVRSASRLGVYTFCVGLEAGGENYLNRIFGKKNVTIIDSLDHLPERLPMLYFRLTA